MRRQRVPLGKAAWATRRVSSGIAKSGWGWSDTGGTRGQGPSGGVSGELLGRPWIFSQLQGRKEDRIRHQCQQSGPSQIASFELDTLWGQVVPSAGVGIQSTSQNLSLGSFRPSNSYGLFRRRFPSRNARQFQYRRFRSSSPWVTVLCRDWCIRNTPFMHPPALLARTTWRNTRPTAAY